MNDREHDLISAYLDGELSPEEDAAFSARLLAEPELRERLEEARRWVALMKTLPELKAPRSYTLTAEQAASLRPPVAPTPRTVIPLPPARSRAPLRPLAFAAASLIVLALVGALLAQINRPPDTGQPAVAIMATPAAESLRAIPTPTAPPLAEAPPDALDEIADVEANADLAVQAEIQTFGLDELDDDSGAMSALMLQDAPAEVEPDAGIMSLEIAPAIADDDATGAEPVAPRLLQPVRPLATLSAPVPVPSLPAPLDALLRALLQLLRLSAGL